MPKIPYTNGEETLGDNYPAAPKEVFVADVVKALIYIKNTHATNGLKYKILAYMDCVDKTGSVKELVAETTLAAGAVAVETLTDPYEIITIPMKNATPGSNATVKAWVNTKVK